MTAERLPSQMFVRVPEILVFENATDADGKVYLDYGSRELLLGPNYEIAVEKYSLDMIKAYNVLAGQYSIKVTSSSGSVSQKEVPACRIVTVEDLLRVLGDMSSIFSVSYTKIRVNLNFRNNYMRIPTPIARCLRLCDASGNPDAMVTAVNPGISVSQGDAEYVEVDARRSGGQAAVLPLNHLENIWNKISKNSFQAIYFYSDLVVQEIVGSQRVPNLGIYPHRENEGINVWEDPAPIYRRVNKKHIAKCYLQLADTRGQKLKDVQVSVQLRLKKRELK